MKSESNRNPITSRKERRNIKLSLNINDKSKTISLIRKTPFTSRNMRQSPILSFPLNYNDNTNPPSLFSASDFSNNPFSLKNHKIIRNIFPKSNMFKKIKTTTEFNKNKKEISKSIFNKQIIFSKKINNKLNQLKTEKKSKKINILDFGNKLKLYDDEEKKRKEKSIIEKREKQLNEIYYDYDKNNKKQIMNSFSGNRADLLKNKVCFVKGIVDYLYPKMILNKIEFLKEMKDKKYRDCHQKLHKILVSKYYKLKHRNPEQNAAISKFFNGDELRLIRPKYNLITQKKTFINQCKVSRLTYDYDYI